MALPQEMYGTTSVSPMPASGPQIAGLSIVEDDYFLPEGGAAAQARFLAILSSFKEIWISAYGFTLQPMFEALKLADERGAKIHILLDHSQASGVAEKPLVAALAASLKNGDITITTAGIGSDRKSNIFHWKAMVVDLGSGPLLCWEGSTNFSGSAWSQGNSARVFSSDRWGEVFKKSFATHQAWALQSEPQYQIPKGA